MGLAISTYVTRLGQRASRYAGMQRQRTLSSASTPASRSCFRVQPRLVRIASCFLAAHASRQTCNSAVQTICVREARCFRLLHRIFLSSHSYCIVHKQGLSDIRICTFIQGRLDKLQITRFFCAALTLDRRAISSRAQKAVCNARTRTLKHSPGYPCAKCSIVCVRGTGPRYRQIEFFMRRAAPMEPPCYSAVTITEACSAMLYTCTRPSNCEHGKGANCSYNSSVMRVC